MDGTGSESGGPSQIPDALPPIQVQNADGTTSDPEVTQEWEQAVRDHELLRNLTETNRVNGYDRLPETTEMTRRRLLANHAQVGYRQSHSTYEAALGQHDNYVRHWMTYGGLAPEDQRSYLANLTSVSQGFDSHLGDFQNYLYHETAYQNEVQANGRRAQSVAGYANQLQPPSSSRGHRNASSGSSSHSDRHYDNAHSSKRPRK